MKAKAEFKVVLKEENGVAVSLKAMSPAALDSFLLIMDAMRTIAKETVSDPEELVFSLEEGSAAAVYSGVEAVVRPMYLGVEEAISGNSTNRQLTKSVRTIQEQVRRQNWEYTVDYNSEAKVVPLRERLLDGPVARTARRKSPVNYRLKVLNGFLNGIGGNDPNYHFDYGGGEKIKISCTQEDANSVKEYLYQDLYVLVIMKEWNDEDRKPEYSHRVTLEDKQLVKQVKLFISNYYETEDLLKRLDCFYDFVEEHLPTENGLRLLNLLLIGFDHEATDINELKTLLVITKGFSENRIISNSRSRIVNRYNLIKG